jgi:surfactin synthase thioesterase subunit
MDLLDSKSDARGENLPHTLFGCSMGAVMRYAPAELREYEF